MTLKPLLTSAKYVYKHEQDRQFPFFFTCRLYNIQKEKGQLKCSDDGRDRTALIFKHREQKKSTGMARRRNEKTPGQSGSFCKRAHITHPEQLMKKRKRKGSTTNNPLRRRTRLSSTEAPPQQGFRKFWTLNLTSIRGQ